MSVVLDASAVLALINDEPGAAAVRAVVRGAAISSVNLAEVGSRIVDLGEPAASAIDLLQRLGLRIVEFDTVLATSSIELRSPTKRKGLSLGDRACLALAVREEAIAVTADRAWAGLQVGCEIKLIR